MTAVGIPARPVKIDGVPIPKKESNMVTMEHYCMMEERVKELEEKLHKLENPLSEKETQNSEEEEKSQD